MCHCQVEKGPNSKCIFDKLKNKSEYREYPNKMQLYFFPGGGQLFHITRRAMNKNDYKELDETIKAKLQPFLYNEGRGKMVPVAHLACLRNRDRALSKQVSTN